MRPSRTARLAEEKKLQDDDELAKQVKRMLRSDVDGRGLRRGAKVRDFAKSFVEQWLGTRAIGREFKPDPAVASRFDSALALVRAAYEDLIALRDDLSPQTHLAFHGYDFAIPDGRGICHLGPWLKPAFDLRGFPDDLVASSAVVKVMLKDFASMLKSLESNPLVTFIETQDTLDPVKSSWHNEMHPSKSGFNQIADLFHAEIESLFPGRVLG